MVQLEEKPPVITEDKTSMFTKGESRIWNVSVRGWLAILIIGSVCWNSFSLLLAHISIAIYNGSVASLNDSTLQQTNGTLERLALITIGWYFGNQLTEHLTRKKVEPS